MDIKFNILEEVIQNPGFMFYLKKNLEDLEFSGLSQDQITKIQYANSIYVRQKHVFEKLKNEINPKNSLLEKLEETVQKILFIKPGDLKIKTQGETLDFLSFVRDFKIPDLKKDEKGERPFEIYHNLDSILDGSIGYYERNGEVNVSVNNNQQGNFIYGPFNNHLDKYYQKLFFHYIKTNNLEDFFSQTLKKITKLRNLLWLVDIQNSKNLLSEINLSLNPYRETPIYFNFVSSKDELEKLLSYLEIISNPEIAVIDRIFHSKNFYQFKHLVVPGDGKKCVIAIHGISLSFKKKIIILNSLKNNGYGGSIILFEGVGLGPLEQCLIREKKLGAIIHNTGTWHKSTLHGILSNQKVTQEERDFCFSIPHNDMGEHGSENLLLSCEFMDKVTNFI